MLGSPQQTIVPFEFLLFGVVWRSGEGINTAVRSRQEKSELFSNILLDLKQRK